MGLVLLEKSIDAVLRSIQDYVDVLIARCRWVLQQFTRRFLIRLLQTSAELIERAAQRRTPVLRPARIHARVTSAVAAPAFNPVGTTPRSVVDDLDFVRRRMRLEILAVIRDLREVVRLDIMQRVSQCHFAVTMMMSIGLTVGRNVHELQPVAIAAETTQQPLGESLSVRQQSFKSDGA